MEKWQRGHQKAHLKAVQDEIVKAATVGTLPEAFEKLVTCGFAVMNDMQSLFPSSCRPSKEQRDYILEFGNHQKEVIFEGAKLSNDNPSFTPFLDKVATHSRKQLISTSVAKNKAYFEKYKAQLACIIKGMFEGEAGDPTNWKMGMTTIVGGVNHQHPHSDFGIPESFDKMKVCPFLTLHGFGIDAYQLWLLPDALNTKYGFLHTFASHQIVFLRGDFVHAGRCSERGAQRTHDIFSVA